MRLELPNGLFKFRERKNIAGFDKFIYRFKRIFICLDLRSGVLSLVTYLDL
jgi:hypothetical protein